MMKRRLAVISLVVLVVAASVMSLGAKGCGSNSGTGKIGTIEEIRTAQQQFGDTQDLDVFVKPTSLAKANHLYGVTLYENGKYRTVGSVEWTQAQINVRQASLVSFPITNQEWSTYIIASDDALRKVFSITIEDLEDDT